MYKAKGK